MGIFNLESVGKSQFEHQNISNYDLLTISKVNLPIINASLLVPHCKAEGWVGALIFFGKLYIAISGKNGSQILKEYNKLNN